MKFIVQWVWIMIVVLGLVSCSNSPTSEAHYTLVKVGNTVVHAIVSDTSEKQVRGLSFTPKMSENVGMLFTYPPRETVLKHWMKDMQFPLDIIWINAHREIIGMHEDAQPCKAIPCAVYSSDKPAQYVLEVNAGFAAKHHIKPGMIVSFV